MLQLANQHNFHIVEDDTYSHIAPEHATRLCALDGLQRTIHVSGFAKILAPNWRVGFLAAHSSLIERLLDTKLLATLTTPALLEKALALCMEQGQLRRCTVRSNVSWPCPRRARGLRQQAEVGRIARELVGGGLERGQVVDLGAPSQRADRRTEGGLPQRDVQMGAGVDRLGDLQRPDPDVLGWAFEGGPHPLEDEHVHAFPQKVAPAALSSSACCPEPLLA